MGAEGAGSTAKGELASRLAAIVGSSDDAIIGKTLTGTITSWNAAATAIYGYTPEEMIGRNISELMPGDRAGELVPILKQLARGERVSHFPTKRVRKDGTVIDVSVSVSPILDDTGTVTGAASVARDITAQIRAETAASRLAAIVGSSDDAIIGKTLTGTITSWNAAATAIYGYTPEEMIGRNISELMPGDRAGELVPILKQLARGERVSHFQTKCVRKDGTVIDVSVSVSPILDDTGTVIGAASVARDITAQIRAEDDRRALQARLARSERLATIGQLAGGIAHDFNNLLGVIIGHTTLLAEEAAGQPDIYADIRRIEFTAQRAARLTKQLLIFSRRDTAQPQDTNLNTVIDDVRDLLSASLGPGIELRLNPEMTLPAIKADRSHLEQVLLNLAANARDAMPRGGTLTIATGTAELDETYCGAHPGARPGHYVQLTVSDTGTGMSPEVAARIFEPFFTTKPMGRGTGLGLSTVHAIVTRSGGSITAQSEEGAGTVFRVYFSAVAAPLPAASASPGSPGSARILLVDDEPDILTIVSRILGTHGYTVLAAHSGQEALSMAYSHDFELLLTDSLMPQMSGAGLAQRITEIKPGLRILHMSGDSAGQLTAERTGNGNVAIIDKPFTAQTLLDKVHAVLSAPPAG